MAGTIGRTLAGKALDEHIVVYKNQTLRHKIFRCIAQLDRAFLGTQDDDWERGVIYANAPYVIKGKFPQKRLALLRKHLYAYAESLFKKEYTPETATQLALVQRTEQKREQGYSKYERDMKLYEIGSAFITAFIVAYLSYSFTLFVLRH